MFLEGYRLIDLTSFGPGPFCSRLLGDMGFDVIRVSGVASDERPPRGQRVPMLFHEPPVERADPGVRNVRGIALDLKRAEGREVFGRLVRGAVAVQEGFRPGVADRLGIGYETLRALKPDIVYVSVTGYGQTGPYRDRAGHDLNYLAVAGFIGMNGRSGGEPAIPGTVIADYAAGGMSAAVHVLAALLRRERTGRGAYCDVSITDAAFELNKLFLDEYLASGIEPRRGETVTCGFWPWYDVYRTEDDAYISVAAIEPHFYRALCAVLGRADLLDHQWSLDRRLRTRDEFRQQFASASRAHWLDAFSGVDTCVAPVNSPEDAVNDPQMRARGMVLEVNRAGSRPLEVIGSMLNFDGARPSPRNWTTEPGQHTDAILEEHGYSRNDVVRLREEGVVA